VTEQDGRYYRSRLFPCYEGLVSDSTVDGLYGILASDEALAHSLCVPTFVFTRQRFGEICGDPESFFLVQRLACRRVHFL
jgi:hypothetical protein